MIVGDAFESIVYPGLGHVCRHFLCCCLFVCLFLLFFFFGGGGGGGGER